MAPYFLSRQELYRDIQRELPANAYPDGPPTAFFSTADSDATAAVFRSMYANLERIYANDFPQTADEKIADWEIKVFGKNLDASLTLQERRDAILGKLRAKLRPTPQDVKAVVLATIGQDKDVEIVEWNCGGGHWVLDVSQLDISTILNSNNRLAFTGPNLCGFTAADFGLTQQEFLDSREEAYTYEVRIYTYTLTAAELAALDAALLEAEPVRSQHLIFSGLNPANKISGDT